MSIMKKLKEWIGSWPVRNVAENSGSAAMQEITLCLTKESDHSSVKFVVQNLRRRATCDSTSGKATVEPRWSSKIINKRRWRKLWLCNLVWYRLWYLRQPIASQTYNLNNSYSSSKCNRLSISNNLCKPSTSNTSKWWETSLCRIPKLWVTLIFVTRWAKVWI